VRFSGWEALLLSLAPGPRLACQDAWAREGSIPDLNPPSTDSADSDFYFVQAEEPEAAVARIVELVKTRIPRRFGLDPVRDIQVVCPMNRRLRG
jgi:hypothetical protein